MKSLRRFLSRARAAGATGIVVTTAEGEEERILLVEFDENSYAGEDLIIEAKLPGGTSISWQGTVRQKKEEKRPDPRESLTEWIALLKSLFELSIGVLVRADEQRTAVFDSLVRENQELRDAMRAGSSPGSMSEAMPLLKEVFSLQKSKRGEIDLDKLRQILGSEFAHHVDRLEGKDGRELAVLIHELVVLLPSGTLQKLASTLSVSDQLWLKSVYDWAKETLKDLD